MSYCVRLTAVDGRLRNLRGTDFLLGGVTEDLPVDVRHISMRQVILYVEPSD